VTPRARRIAGRTPPVNRTLGKISGTYDLRGGSENSIRATLPRTAASSPKPLRNLAIWGSRGARAGSAPVVPRGTARRPRSPPSRVDDGAACLERRARASGEVVARGEGGASAFPSWAASFAPSSRPSLKGGADKREGLIREGQTAPPRPNTLTSRIGGLYRPKSIGRDLAVPTNRPAFGVVRFHDRAERFSYTFVGFAKVGSSRVEHDAE